ncbi:hypothetical protein [Halosimplex pelagicum]|uniref:Uncharacterized protein n=1 Tax=Halosimplex pelagicum TaxID=869886 RepID=A0A7D5TUG9_9EURY|nr:hypothetical protein [Halosimplex pelagicum]QLH82334.1 hypothetical protein HZS54_12230 [Halosimplex pelagicum]
MTHSQEPLTAFDDVETDQPNSPSESTSNEEPSHNLRETDTEDTDFSNPESYPDSSVDSLSSSEITINLCAPDGTVSPTFLTVAGSGGMGAGKSVEAPGTVVGTLEACIGLPVLVTGGGMSTPMGSGAILGCLLGVTRSGDGVRVELKEVYQQQGTSRREKRTLRLGAYEVSLPESTADCREALRALVAWERDEVDYLNPVERQKHEIVDERLKTFEKLSPADKLETPEYASRLEVVSEPFDTHAVIPRGTLSNRTVEVLAVTVNNPNGGYYQLGIERGKSTMGTNEIPTCYLSTSAQSPPTPNTAFTRDAKFSSTELEVTPIEHPPDPEVIPPDKEILNSPLPEPRLRTSVDELDGVGEKTAMKLHRTTDNRVSAESLAYTMFGNSDIHNATLSEIKAVLKSLPRKEQVYEQLKKYTPER